MILDFSRPPEDALAWFQAKGYRITWGWREMAAAEHARGFTVAGIMKLDVLQDIRAELTRALAEGGTYADFKRRLVPILQAKGWWGRNAQTDPETGEMAGKGLTPRRLETIFRANIQSAYMAGRYRQQMEMAGLRPWWQYVAVMDSRTRPQHAALNGRIFRYDDPFWQRFFPPLGFNCRCRTRAWSESEIRARGLDTSVSGKALQQVRVEDPHRPGQQLDRWRFEYAPGKYIAPDIGWDGNPGADAGLWKFAARKLDAAPRTLAAQAVQEMVAGPDFARWFAAPEGDFPLVVIPDADAALIRARVHTGLLSADSARKQAAEHPELTPAEYAQAQQAIDQATGKVRHGRASLVYIREIPAGETGGYVLVVKATATGKGLWVTSYRRLSRKEAERDIEVGRLIKKGEK